MCASFSSVMQRLRNQLCCPANAVVIALLVLGVGATVTEADTGTFIYAGCSPSKYDPGSPFEGNLKSLLTSITNASPNGAYNSFTAAAAATGPPSTGCTSAAATWATATARRACGRPWRGSTRCARRLRGVAPAGGMLRALRRQRLRGAARHGHGVPQVQHQHQRRRRLPREPGRRAGRAAAGRGCQRVQGEQLRERAGGLAVPRRPPPRDCTACWRRPVGQLKGTCGTALAADVHLAQCYVRYWASGYYFRPSQGTARYPS
ncbi:hypothetical protein ACQ4PT_063563 [Festuca glaucescens]